MHEILGLGIWIRSFLLGRASSATEILALRQQLAVLKRQSKRPQLHDRDRLFWILLKRFWPRWRDALLIVQPETVVRWHRAGFRHYWRWKSRPKGGRKPIGQELGMLIRRLCRENPIWGAPRIQSELTSLGYSVSEATVAKYMPARPRRPSATWNMFLRNHLHETVAIDFFTVPTATFRLLYCFVVLHHDRRRILHFNVTAHPHAMWISQQLVEAFPFDEAPRFLIRDRDGKYGEALLRRITSMGIEDTPTSPGSPWQNPYCERFVGSVRRECLNHVIVLSEQHLKRIVQNYLDYYHDCRTHLSLDRNSPNPRPVAPRDAGEVYAIPRVGGLHHEYRRAA
jgi:transposase InsO family protein